MDAYKQLSLELAGIEKILKSYSGNSSAYNILPNLKEAMTTGDKDAILYCLDVIIDWYEKNINDIHSNQFYFKDEEHDRIFNLTKNIRNEIEEHDICCNTFDNKEANDKPLIFLSHRSSDKKYGDALEKFIVGLGVRNDQLIYTLKFLKDYNQSFLILMGLFLIPFYQRKISNLYQLLLILQAFYIKYKK